MPSSEDQSDVGDTHDRKISGLRRHARAQNQQSLERIRAAAEVLFTQKGYISVTMDQIAREAGVTRQTLYRHFPSKYEIAVDFLTGSQPRTLEIWRSLKNHNLKDRQSLLSWIGSVISHHVNRRDSQAYVELASTEPAYRAVLADEIATIINALGEIHPAFAMAAHNPDSLIWAKTHLFIATLMERSDFIALKEEWFKAEHLEQIMADWLIALTSEDG